MENLLPTIRKIKTSCYNAVQGMLSPKQESIDQRMRVDANFFEALSSAKLESGVTVNLVQYAVIDARTAVSMTAVLKDLELLERQYVDGQHEGGLTSLEEILVHHLRSGKTMRQIIHLVKTILVAEAIKIGGSKSAAARILGIGRTTLVEEMKQQD